jgi:hypothetical protein
VRQVSSHDRRGFAGVDGLVVAPVHTPEILVRDPIAAVDLKATSARPLSPMAFGFDRLSRPRYASRSRSRSACVARSGPGNLHATEALRRLPINIHRVIA